MYLVILILKLKMVITRSDEIQDLMESKLGIKGGLSTQMT